MSSLQLYFFWRYINTGKTSWISNLLILFLRVLIDTTMFQIFMKVNQQKSQTRNDLLLPTKQRNKSFVNYPFIQDSFLLVYKTL